MNTNGVPIIQPRVGPSRTGEELPWVFVQTKHPTLTEMSAKGDVFESGSLQR
jgi:hypothetical protein